MSKKIHESVSMDKPQSSGFDLSHEKKMSVNFGKLYPCLLQEVLPSDHWDVRSETLIRMAPMIAPIMERIDVFIHYFFVPNRIIWDEWESFITGGDDGNESPTMPTASPGIESNMGKGSLADYLGLPVTGSDPSNAYTVSSLPFRAYHEIWNEYYRDQNLQPRYDITNQNSVFYGLRHRAWTKDYFTSALPFPQKGPAVNLPVTSNFTPQYKNISNVKDSGGTNLPNNSDLITNTDELGFVSGVFAGARIENLTDTQVVDSTAFTIEELRRSARLQEWLEKAARGGTRLVELIKNFFNVNIGDARLDRPEYLGGGKTPITVSEVLNTTGTPEAAQGDMAGHGIAVGANNSFNYKVKEHGYIMGIMSILPKASYKQGIERHWKRTDKFDYVWPQFANIGEQEVKNEELFFDFNSDSENDETFGYQQRYAEYKYACNTVHGDLRDNLDFWTLCRDFDSLPNLNSDFITCNDPVLQNIFAVTDPTIDKFYCQIFHNIKAKRPLPYFSRPEL